MGSKKGPNLLRKRSYFGRVKCLEFKYWNYGYIVVEGRICKVEVEDLQQLPLELELKMYKLVKQNIALT